MRTAWISCVAVVWFCVCACAWPDTHYVSLDGSDEAPYLTPETAARCIQRAVDAASPGDAILVAPGDYREHVVMGTGLTLAGSGREGTRILGSIRAGIDSEIRELALLQEAPRGDPDYASVAITGPDTGGLIVARCGVSGTYDTGVRSWVDGGYALILGSEIRGVRAHPVLSQGIDMQGRWGGRPLFCVVDNCVLEDCAIGVQAATWDRAWVMRTRFSGNRQAIAVSENALVLACSIDSSETGIFVSDCARAAIESTKITRSSAAAVRCQDATEVRLTNCTITDNACGVTTCYVDRVEARSCIIWGNGVDVNAYYGPLSPGEFSAWCSDIGASPDYEYLHDQSINYGNIDADPLFVNPDAGDYRLKPQSPCIDTGSGGNYQAAELSTAYDLGGKPRIAYGGAGGGVDMGAYEYYINCLQRAPLPAEVTLTWSSRRRKTYAIFYSDDLLAWHLAAADVLSMGYETTSWIDDGSKTGVPPSLAPRRFYRILENR